MTDDWAVALDLDSLRSSHPIQVDVASADQVSEIFDAISYYKGASVIRSVYDWIGEAAFQAGLQAYLKKFAFSNTVPTDQACRPAAWLSGVLRRWYIRGGLCQLYDRKRHPRTFPAETDAPKPAGACGCPR